MTTPATIPLTYNGYVSALCAMVVEDTTTVAAVVQSVNAPFNTLLPSFLDYAENRIQRDLDLWPALTSNTYALTIGNNLLSIPTGDFVAVQTISVNVSGQNIPLWPASKEFLQTVYGNPSATAQPQYFAPYGGDAATGGATSNNFIVGPYPNAAYNVSVTGTTRLPSLGYNNTTPLANTATTFISTWLPDLLLQASMIMASQYQRNFGPASNDPAMGPTYEAQYQNLLKGAIVEEARKRFAAPGWTPNGPTPIATPSRG